MRFSILSTLVVALAADSAVASSWFGKAAYNKWHETELERWLSDHSVPYPTPADRKDLENLVKQNWNDKLVTPYNTWDAKQLQGYLTVKGQEAKKGTEKNTNSLIAQVKNYWTETEEQASSAYSGIWNWIFDSWTESQLKSFLDRHGIPAPQPRTRDSLLKSVRENYQTAATKIGETTAYPGDWLYQSWSESDLKAWLDERGYPAPQPSTRDKLIASVRRNSRLASLNVQAAASSVSASAASAQQTLTDALFDAWSDSQVKEWLDKNDVKVPQGSRRNELIALARKHRARLTGDTVASSASSAYGAASTSAGNEYVKATDGAAYYLDWIKSQIGLGVQTASASAVSASSVASVSASSASSAASSAASSIYSSVSSAASKSGAKATDAASSGSSAYSSAFSSAASVASKSASVNAASASSAAASSASSASSVASVSASSASSAASSAASSIYSSVSKAASKSGAKASDAASSGSSAYSSAYSSATSAASKSAQKASHGATESATSAKNRVAEAAQKATDYAKEL